MRIGVVFPQTEFPSDPVAIRTYAEAVEDFGYTHILAYDHVLGANPRRPGGLNGPYTFQDSFQSPLLLFSFMAAVTSQIEFTTGILILPQRQTALFAKQAATLDVLSRGRLRLGLGIGWNEVEYIALNSDFHTRGAKIEEQVEVLRALWTRPLVTYKGRWNHIPDAGINPLPVQRPIPIWFGGHADPVLRRVARTGDGWMPNYRTPEQASDALNRLRAYLTEANRKPVDIGIEPRLHYGLGREEEWLELSDAWKNEGATHLSINTMGSGFSSVDEHLSALEHFSRVMLPK